MHNFGWLTDRSAGVLLHPTSLPSEQGIGVLGPTAHAFIDFLKDADIRYWQMLPLSPTGYGDSPYASFSAFAGNPYLIDLDPLLENGILKSAEVDVLRGLPTDHVDFASLYRIKWPLLRLAHKRFVEQKRSYLPNYGLYEDFLEAERTWLEPYAAFMGLKDRFGGAFWGEWPEETKGMDRARKSHYWDESTQARDAHAFTQYLFFGQWRLVREHALRQGVEIIGDAPIFVALDGADVWARPELFELAKPGKPSHVAGVPPDYFSKTGQLWGNPLYDWEAMENDGYHWWIERLKANFALFDIVRLDHFRGFYNYWRIPAEAKDARKGTWEDGPREALFEAVAKELPTARLIAEDLGDMDEGVREFRHALGLPGMAILQFAYGNGSDNIYLPHNLERNSVLYPGTHDNNTTLGWYESVPEEVRDHVRRYLRVSGEDISWDFIRSAYASVSRLVIVPMQDLMALGDEARMNAPGTEQGNWQWRMSREGFDYQRQGTAYLRELASLYGRAPLQEGPASSATSG